MPRAEIVFVLNGGSNGIVIKICLKLNGKYLIYNIQARVLWNVVGLAGGIASVIKVEVEPQLNTHQ